MPTTKLEVLKTTSFGHRVAEEEAKELAGYFVETDEWRRVFAGETDVVYGAKGSGKSALYALLLQRADELLDRQVIIVAAENPRGATVFKDLQADPPLSELEFASLWKLYFISLIGRQLKSDFFSNSHAKIVISALEDAKLIEKSAGIRAIFHAVKAYIGMLFRPEAVEGGLKIDPTTGLPNGITGKISFREPKANEAAAGVLSMQHLFDLAVKCLEESSYSIWLALDRLDVAFSDSPELEENALRALFRVYLDLRSDMIRLKIFLRSDIWQRITESGFREASHITRSLTLKWNSQALLNLSVRRALQNESVRKFYAVDAAAITAEHDAQKAFFYRMCPDQVDVGGNKPSTFDWILSRTVDGLKKNAPRELIHLMNSIRDVQLKKLELGESDPPEELLFARPSFKDALPEVSKVRLEQTLYAEHPTLKTYVEALRRQKASQTISSLARHWQMSEEESYRIASQLVEVGFFERRKKTDGIELWVPFIYRDVLEMTQGSDTP